MKCILLPDEKEKHRLSFYLAMEEFVARHIDEHDCFFVWQVEPSVIFGRNQLIENEVNIDFCRERGIQMYRRKSGGGCVYADLGNLMLSYITSEENSGFTFHRYINMLVLVLWRLGVEAKASGRNDIMVGDRKVSGNAFYHIPGRSIVHGTLLYDTNMENMVGAITPTREKLTSKGVESVRQRIALLKDLVDIDMDTLKASLREQLCDGELRLSVDDVSVIEDLEKEYFSQTFIEGNNPKYTLIRRDWLLGVGELEARMEVKNGVILSLNLMGDYFIVGEVDVLLRKLKGVALNREALLGALPERLDDFILNLEKEDFIKLLLQ